MSHPKFSSIARDPLQVIDSQDITEAKNALDIPEYEIRSRYEKINEILGKKLKLAWSAQKDESGYYR